MTIERRLHHAARELREIPVTPADPPPSQGTRGVVAKAMAMAAPVVVLGLGVLGGAALLQIDPADDRGGEMAAVAPTNPPARVIGPDHVESAATSDLAPAPTAVEEVAMISALSAGVESHDRPAIAAATSTAAPSNAS